VPVIAAVQPFDSVLHAEYLANEVPNIRVPEALLNRMRRTDGPEAAAAEGIAIAQEIAAALRDRAQGLQVSGPMASVLAVLEGV
jgi:5,10-methylenetetrahydrofolate reductase